MMKRIISALLAVLLLAAFPVSAFAAEEDTIREAFETTGDYMASLGEPSAGSTGGEWMVLGFARSGREVPDSYYDSVVAYVEEHIDENGRLHATKCTTNCRFIVALTSIGKNVSDVGGHNLLSGLNDLSYIKKVGVSGVIWTLIAFDCGNYEMPEGIDRETLVRTILEFQVPGGGWATSGNLAVPDVTSMAIQALAPYREKNTDVPAALDAAITVLSNMQDSTGNFPSQYGASSESVSQVIVALATLGIDPNTDERFVKDGASALDGLLSYYVEGSGFKHILSGKIDGMATEQGYYALAAYFRLLEDKAPLYDMTDGFTVTPQEPAAQEQPIQDNNMVWLGAVLGVGAVFLILCFALKKKLGKKKFSNALMVVVIFLVAALGIGFAIQMDVFNNGAKLGSEFKTTAIPDNRLVISVNTENTCTITIHCDTVLNNLNLLEEAKVPYVPADGVILPEITVEFAPGESVFDVLQRVCEAADIPLEYSWTPLYDSYYLEGICHLYEFDCGAESGWMYQVNGSFPNYGCSSYEIHPGDRIEWLYSCIGLGADLGADVMEG